MWYGLLTIVILGVILMPTKISTDFSFDSCFKIVVGLEGVYSVDPNDKGNWTGGKVGYGEMRGTKYGISAKAFPTLDIKNLTLAQAKEIYSRDYWNKMLKADPILNLIAFDCAVNQGVKTSNSINNTVNLLTPLTPDGKLASFANLRLEHYRQLSDWERYGNGWTNRVKNVLNISLSNLTTKAV